MQHIFILGLQLFVEIRKELEEHSLGTERSVGGAEGYCGHSFRCYTIIKKSMSLVKRSTPHHQKGNECKSRKRMGLKRCSKPPHRMIASMQS